MWKSKLVTFATKGRGMLSSRLGPKSWGLFWFNEPLRPCLGQSWPNWDVPGYFSSEGGGRSAARGLFASQIACRASKQPPPARGAAEERQESGPLPSVDTEPGPDTGGGARQNQGIPSQQICHTYVTQVLQFRPQLVQGAAKERQESGTFPSS